MNITPNNAIRIIRLQNGEDIMANIVQDEDNDTVMLDNPMHIIFKRMPTGQIVLMMLPWLPIEIIKENNAIIDTSDILTIIEPKDDLVRHYDNVVSEAHGKMIENKEKMKMNAMENSNEKEEFNPEDIFRALEERKNRSLH